MTTDEGRVSVSSGSAIVSLAIFILYLVTLAPNTGADPYANAVQPIGGTLQALKTPSAQQSGLKLKTNFTIEEGETTNLVADFDACKSVVVAGQSGQYILKPVVSIGAMHATSIQGYVTTTMNLSSTTVSAQKDGSIVRSTTPDASGTILAGALSAIALLTVIASPASRAWRGSPQSRPECGASPCPPRPGAS